MPSTKSRIIMSRPVIISVQAVLGIQFLTIVLVWLEIGIGIGIIQSERIVLVAFLYRTICISHHTVVTQVVLDVIVVTVIRKVNVSRFGKQQPGRTVFIDHVSTVVGCGGCTVYYMHRAELSSIHSVQVSDGVAISKRNYRWQIKRIILNIANILVQIFRQVAVWS